MSAPSPLLRSKLFWIGVLYFSEGFPFGIFFEVVPVWYRENGVELRSIGLLSLLGLAWSLKFLWAPLVDRYRHHRRWMAAADLVMAALLVCFALGFGPWVWIGVAALALVSATNDIAIDGYTIELLERDELGIANGVRIGLYRVGMLAAGSAIALAGWLDWAAAFATVAAMLVACGAAVLRAPRERVVEVAPLGLGREIRRFGRDPRLAAALAGLVLLSLAVIDQAVGPAHAPMLALLEAVRERTASGDGLWSGALAILMALWTAGRGLLWAIALVVAAGWVGVVWLRARAAASGPREPAASGPPAAIHGDGAEGPMLGALVELLARPGIVPVLLFVLVFKLGDAAMGFMVKPFWLDAGFALAEIGLVSVNLGLGLTIAGGLLGGWYTDRAGIFRALWVLGLLQALSNLGYAGAAWLWSAQAVSAPDAWLRAAVYSASGLESLTAGLGTGAFLAFLMAIVDRRRPATEFALLSSLFALSRSIAGWAGGEGAQQLGYASFFMVTFFLAFPAYLLLPWVRRALETGSRDAQPRSFLRR